MLTIQPGSAMKTSRYASEPAVTSSCDVTDRCVDDVLPSRSDDVTELSSGRGQVSNEPVSTQFISDTCILLTYFTGDVESNVNQHFARALSQCDATAAPHAAIPSHSAAWIGKFADRHIVNEFTKQITGLLPATVPKIQLLYRNLQQPLQHSSDTSQLTTSQPKRVNISHGRECCKDDRQSQ